MRILRAVRNLFTDSSMADPTKPTDQAVTNKIRASRDASIHRQQVRETRRRHNDVERRYIGERVHQ